MRDINWRAAVFAMVPLLLLAVLMAACGGKDSSIGASVRIVLEADLSRVADIDPTDALDTAADIIERRMDAYGASANVRREGDDRLFVEIAGSIEAPEAEELVARTGLLEFREPKMNEHGDVYVCEGGTVAYDPPGCEGGQEAHVSSWGWEPSPQDEESVIWVPAFATGSDGQ
jgi:hypothetical protein